MISNLGVTWGGGGRMERMAEETRFNAASSGGGRPLNWDDGSAASLLPLQVYAK